MLVKHCVGINVIHDDISVMPDIIKNTEADNSVIYFDPPYNNMTGYGFTLDQKCILSSLFDATLSPIYVSENIPLSNECVRLNFNGAKGGISGKKRSKHEEWISVFR